MAQARASIGTIDYAVSITAGRHALTADEPAEDGGGDAGPAPSELLCAALCACTSITLRMYAKRKGWPLRALHVDVNLVRSQAGGAEQIDVTISFVGELSEEQRLRLLEIAEHCPVHRMLAAGVGIRSSLEPA
jgi:putative redox protein